MRNITKEELKKIIEDHVLWRKDLSTGKKADFCGVDFCGVDLCGVDLCGVDLCGVDLCGVDLCGARIKKNQIQNLLISMGLIIEE